MVLIIVAIAVAALIYFQKQRTKRLRNKYGPEYDRLTNEYGSAKRAESDLDHREKRLAKINIRALSKEETDRFAESWRAVQAGFVDDPSAAVGNADNLVGDLMKTRGYPMGDFEQRAADISVDHPRVVEHYRAAHTIASRTERGDVNTEDMRQAMVHYRALFDELIEAREPATSEVRR